MGGTISEPGGSHIVQLQARGMRIEHWGPRGGRSFSVMMTTTMYQETITQIRLKDSFLKHEVDMPVVQLWGWGRWQVKRGWHLWGAQIHPGRQWGGGKCLSFWTMSSSNDVRAFFSLKRHSRFPRCGRACDFLDLYNEKKSWQIHSQNRSIMPDLPTHFLPFTFGLPKEIKTPKMCSVLKIGQILFASKTLEALDRKC